MKIETTLCNEATNNIVSDFAVIADYKAPYLKEHVLKKGLFESDAEFDVVFQELKKYLFICGKADMVVAMLDDRVDALWHEFILFTGEYRNFCRKTLGKFIDHRPNTSSTPTVLGSAKAFFDLYRHYFGFLPDIWKIKQPSLLVQNYNDINQSRLAGDNCGGTDCGGNCDNTVSYILTNNLS